MPERDIHHLETSAVTMGGDAARAGPAAPPAPPTPPSTGAASGADSFFPNASPSAGDASTCAPQPQHPLPQRIGRYEIKRLIGSGGMGAVYEAVQEQPRRTVALKVMRSAVATPAALRRFEYEAELLGKLRHPGIAQVYDAGTHQDSLTHQSVPYFAMEYIPDARALTTYAEEVGLTLRQKLELFLTVCDAVQHGHQRAIIHRDLKPANILVDQQGTVKIIDFGVARSAEPEAAVMTQHTTVGQLVGTLQYMAPEQCGGDPADIDVRADVYALGVTLYELVIGRHPYALSGRSLAEAVRTIRETPPTLPSTHIRELRGDLDTIILKALEKEPASRYDSTAALAADITRFLNNETILARPVGIAGRSIRWVKRNRAVATVVGISLTVLATTSVVLVTKILRESHRANANLVDAERNLLAAKENFALIKGLFGSMRPGDQQQGMVNVEQILDAAAQRLVISPPELPATEADFREILAEGYRGTGFFAKAIEHEKRVIAIRERILPDPSPVLADSLHMLGAALWWNGQYDEAETVYTRSLGMRRALYGPKNVEVATSMTHLAGCYLRQGRLVLAEDLYSQVLAMRRELLPPGSPELAASLNNLAKVKAQRGDSEGAERLFRQALEMIIAAKGEDDLETGNASHNFGGFLADHGQPEEARSRFEQALKIRTSRFRATHPLIAATRLGLARVNYLISPGMESVGAAREALGSLESELPSDHVDIADACTIVGRMLFDLDQANQAEPYLRRALSIYKDPARASPWELAQSQLLLGRCLAAITRDNKDAQQRNIEETEKLLLSSVELLASGDAPARLRDNARAALASLYDAIDRPDDARRVRNAAPVH